MVEEKKLVRVATPYRFRDGNWGAMVKAWQPGFGNRTIYAGDEILVKASNGKRWPAYITWIRWRDSDTAIVGTGEFDDIEIESCMMCDNGAGTGPLWVYRFRVGFICGACNQRLIPGRIGTYEDAVAAGRAEPLNSRCVFTYDKPALPAHLLPGPTPKHRSVTFAPLELRKAA